MPGKGGKLQEDMKLNLPRDRFLNDRKSLLAELDKLNRQADASGSIAAADDTQQQAYEVYSAAEFPRPSIFHRKTRAPSRCMTPRVMMAAPNGTR